MSTDKLVVGVFRSEGALLAAIRAARAAGLEARDAYTPYPVHGMDEALGLRRSGLSKVCFAFGLSGLLLTLAFQYWVSLFNWPMNVGGKSYDASPALIPVAFELTVLFAGLGTVFTFLRRRRLHPGRRPAMAGLGALDDKFLLALSESGAAGPEPGRFLIEQGASEVRRMQA